jgi:MFS family permease
MGLATMKLEMNRAWNDAMALIGANKDVLFVVAGVFFFLPYFVFMLMMPDVSTSMTDPATDEQALARITDFYGRLWWLVLVLSIIQGIGMLGILALLTDYRRPTVAEALKIGASKILSYLAAYLLLGLAFGLIAIALVGGLAATGSVGASVVGIFASVVLLAYFFTKFSLVPPVLVKEGISNPITALARSWQLTKGNSLRLFGFYFLLIIALSVVMIVISMVVTFTLSLLGTEAMMFGSGLVSALMNAVWATAFLAVLASVHSQLGGTSPAQISETFE